METTPIAATSPDDKVSFLGTYAATSFNAENKSILFLGGDDKLYYPQDGAHINAFRSYFQLNDDLTVGDPAASVKAFNLSFGENEPLSIINCQLSIGEADSSWYDLNGRQLSSRPTKRGLYINNGKIKAVQ